MNDRPTLPELHYCLWLPALGLYVRQTGRLHRRFIGAVNQADAVQLPESKARAVALALIRSTGQVIELRQAGPGPRSEPWPTRGASPRTATPAGRRIAPTGRLPDRLPTFLEWAAK